LALLNVAFSFALDVGSGHSRRSSVDALSQGSSFGASTALTSKLLIACVLLVFAGCGSDPIGRHGVSGTVTVDGAPLAQGNISFQPTEGQPTMGGAVVKGGKYAVPKDGGLVPGKYRVSINAPVPGTGGGAAEGAMPGDPPAAPKEMIPKSWNTESSHYIEVKKQGPFVFPLEVNTKDK
jgi:hypothetical protein